MSLLPINARVMQLPGRDDCSKGIGLFVVVLLLLLCQSSGFAQTHQMRFEHISVEDGLSSLTPFLMVQDTQGFLWIATEDALNRYDGYVFTVFRSNPADSTSLSKNLIAGLAVDSDGNVWATTENDILHRYDPDRNTFIRHKIVPPSGRQLGYRLNLGGITPDSGGILWIATNGGLCMFNRHSQESIFFNHNPHDTATLSANTLRKVCVDRSGFLWIATTQGVNRLNKRDGAVRRFSFQNAPFKPGHNDVQDIAIDAQGTVWAATFSGLIRFDQKAGEFVPVYKHVQGGNLGTDVFISKVYADGKGIVWAGAFSAGLFRIDPVSGSISQYTHDPANLRSINDNRVTCIFQDRSEVLWVGTYRVGLNKYDRRRDRFSHYFTDRGVFAIHENAAGDLWLGGYGFGVRVYEKGSDRLREFRPHPATPGTLRGAEVYALREDPSGDMLLATNFGIEIYSRKSAQFRQHPLDVFLKNKQVRTVKSLLYDTDGELWAGTFVPNLLRYDAKTGRMNEYRHIPSDGNSILPGEIWALYQDRKGRIWIGSFSGGLGMFDKKLGTFTLFQHNDDDPSSFPAQGVYAIAEDDEGTIWIGAVGGGLVRFDVERKRFKQYTVHDGLADNFVKSILVDAKGTLWLGSDKGISMFDSKSETFQNLNEKDGLHGSVFLSGSAFQNRTGRLYFGGEGGATAFHPDSLKPKEYKPPVVLTSFNVFDKPFVLERSIIFSPDISLKHDEHTFSFEFVALDYSLPGKNRYAYMLVGLDTAWVQAGTRRYASYTHIPPGSYTFRVRGSNSDGVWNEEGASVRLVIAPPFWETWWFRIAAGVFIVALGAAIYNYRVNRLLEIERLRVRIASDLHDDIGSSLTKISLQSELIQEGFEPEERDNYLKNIAAMSRELVTSMSDIVWSIDARNDTIESMLDKMKSFASSTLAAKDIGFSFAYSGLDVKKKVPVDLRENLYLIFKEAVNNIAKHAGASKVNVVLRNDADGFKMMVVDDGKGWEGNERPSGHGTKNMKMRAERLGGTIEFVRDEGTRVTFTVRRI